ncbi:MAG: hypothetical protein LBB34_00225 [Holosporales bacterium]|nr:hypothetical protein [Holosporales bacterium]
MRGAKRSHKHRDARKTDVRSEYTEDHTKGPRSVMEGDGPTRIWGQERWMAYLSMRGGR